MQLFAILALAVVHLHMTAITLRYPGSVASVALQSISMRFHFSHGDHSILALPLLGQLQGLEDWHLEIIAGGRMHNNLVTTLYDITERITAGSQQVTILLVVVGSKHCGHIQR